MVFHNYILLTIQVTVGELPLNRFTFDVTHDQDDNFGENSSDTTGQYTDDSDGNSEDPDVVGNSEEPDVVDDVLFYPLPPLHEIKGFFSRYVRSD